MIWKHIWVVHQIYLSVENNFIIICIADIISAAKHLILFWKYSVQILSGEWNNLPEARGHASNNSLFFILFLSTTPSMISWYLSGFPSKHNRLQIQHLKIQVIPWAFYIYSAQLLWAHYESLSLCPHLNHANSADLFTIYVLRAILI